MQMIALQIFTLAFAFASLNSLHQILSYSAAATVKPNSPVKRSDNCPSRCASCGVKMKQRSARKGGGKCRQTDSDALIVARKPLAHENGSFSDPAFELWSASYVSCGAKLTAFIVSVLSR